MMTLLVKVTFKCIPLIYIALFRRTCLAHLWPAVSMFQNDKQCRAHVLHSPWRHPLFQVPRRCRFLFLPLLNQIIIAARQTRATNFTALWDKLCRYIHFVAVCMVSSSLRDIVAGHLVQTID